VKDALLVLGASSQVGLEIIKKVHRNYEYIYAHYGHNDIELLAIKREIGDKLILIKEDFSKQGAGTQVVSCIDEVGKIPEHIIHLPALPYENVKFAKAGLKPFECGMQTSVYSYVTILQYIIPKIIKEKKEGRIIVMLSSCVNNIPPKFTSPYVTIKYALLGLVKELSAEYADKSIMVNGVSPGMMETKFLTNVPDLIIKQNATSSPFGRNLMVEEVVPVFDFLLSDEATRITGQNIVVSGGM
jgi:3-oxoacyl-[acyl-carrier protein] reductase